MTNPSAFNKDIIPTIDIEKKSDIFEELNLPPEFADFCRKNMRNIQIIAICIAVTMVSWAGYDYYASTQAEKSSAALSVAMHEQTEDVRAAKLVQLIEKHSGSDAALWSLVELGHNDLKFGRFQEAIKRYSEALENIDETSPLSPLLHFSL
ncbi:MAG: tetratricopeptide repeat protein, partial [Desulfobulbaceae bacterium]|nr:tetratricopeptide repeat protein [Desulfobulbaceae bacterium]